MTDRKRLADLRKYLRVRQWPFKRIELFNQALTHRSYANERKASEHNETLEFLGDSVLQLMVNEHLFRTYPDYRESRLSRIKSYIVSKKTLYIIAQEIRLGSLLLLGRGEFNTGGLIKESNLANALEAVIGALYLDRGFDAVKKGLMPLFIPHIRKMANNEVDFDNKSQLQEYAQKAYKTRPLYQLIETSGPEHNMLFKVSVLVNGQICGSGEGARKIIAEDRAARNALEKLKRDKPETPAGLPKQQKPESGGPRQKNLRQKPEGRNETA